MRPVGSGDIAPFAAKIVGCNISALTGVSYLAGGLITLPVLALALVTGPFYGLGLYIGSHLFGRTSERGYRWACYGLIAMASIVSLPALDTMLGR
ncbi:hypothetical protein [Mesorhizobium erdmanii]|uniref:hypothetical protein n=1 Tax=Mesorhizobium erdmanii TaxID=1777866 RepID=UPI000426E4CE|nr:hypothetical protein [Mesorhizobium erdmanii]